MWTAAWLALPLNLRVRQFAAHNNARNNVIIFRCVGGGQARPWRTTAGGRRMRWDRACVFIIHDIRLRQFHCVRARLVSWTGPPLHPYLVRPLVGGRRVRSDRATSRRRMCRPNISSRRVTIVYTSRPAPLPHQTVGHYDNFFPGSTTCIFKYQIYYVMYYVME